MGNSRDFPDRLVFGSFTIPVGFLARSWEVLFSFEFVFAFFLFAGVFKKNPRFSWVPVDLTALSFGLSLALGIFCLYKSRWKINRTTAKRLIGFAIFFFWALLSLGWSEAWSYGVRKAIFLVVMGSWGMVGAGLIIGPDRNRLLRFFSTIVVLSIFMATEVVLHIADGTLLEEWDFASNYLGLGRLLGLGVLILAGILIGRPLGAFKRITVAILMGFLLSVLMIAGGRGPFLSTLFPLLVPVVVGSRIYGRRFLVDKKLIVLMSLLVVVLVGFIIVGNQYFGFTTIDRLWFLLDSGGGGSAQFRVWYFSKALSLWQEAPFVGHGIGEFGVQLGWGDTRAYPHNIFLEILVELGIVGLGLFLLAVVLTVNRLSLSLVRSDFWLYLVLMLVINAFLNAMVSGDMPDNRVLFALLGLFAGRSQPNRQSGVGSAWSHNESERIGGCGE